MPIRCSNLVLRETPEFRRDFEHTIARMRELATAFTRFLLTGIKAVYFADVEELWQDYAFNADMHDEDRVLIAEFCQGIFDARSKGDVANHAMPFLCRPNSEWDRMWGEGGSKRAKSYSEKDNWKNAGLRLLERGRLPVVDCPKLELTMPHMRQFALSTLYSVISRLDSTKEAMKRWQKERQELINRLNAARCELSALTSERTLFETALTAAEETGLVQVNGRLMRNWKTYCRKDRRCQDCYREFFDSLRGRGLEKVAESFFEERILAEDLTRLRTPSPKLPGIDLPVDLHLGLSTSIYIQPKLEHIDIGKPLRVRKRDSYRSFLVSVPLIGPDGNERTHRVEALYSGYFENLKVSPVVGDKGESKGVRLQFNKNARNAPASAVVKEFDIGLAASGSIIARISHNVEVDDVRAGQAERIVKYFTGLAPNADFPADALQAGDRVMSVDLGVNPLFAWSVCEYRTERPEGDEVFDVDGGGCAVCVENKAFTRAFSQDEKDIDTFADRVISAKQLLNYYKKLNAGKTVSERWRPEAHLQRLGLESEADAVVIREALAVFVAELRRDFRRLKNQRPGHSTACLAQYKWAEAVGDFISLVKAWSRKHRDPKEKGNTYQDGDFESYHSYQTNLRKDLCRKVADEIVRVAERHSAKVVIFERLQGFRPSQSRERSGNRLLANWARAVVVDAVKLALESRAIGFAEVDPRHTSQRDPVTGEWGFRDRDFKTRLFVRRAGTVVVKHADKYAAVLNLQRRFWDRNSDLVYVKAVETIDGRWVPKDVTKTLERACLRGLKARRFVLLPEPAGCLLIRGISEREHERLLSQRLQGRREAGFYRHGETWLDSEQHYSRIMELKTEFQASRRGDQPDDVTPDDVE